MLQNVKVEIAMLEPRSQAGAGNGYNFSILKKAAVGFKNLILYSFSSLVCAVNNSLFCTEALSISVDKQVQVSR